MDRRSGEVADPAWALAKVDKPAKQRAPQSGRTAEPGIAAAGRERRRADQPFSRKNPVAGHTEESSPRRPLRSPATP